ncbi:hypothetical protein [Anaerosacchariphilus polymeriproducens]|uniref:Uncharacterized protein n=1 Tax=Anaerosacchariphilus polymeriproducens TaxID=1812858 RepID=A0A371AXC3_9FIRM|nr:hypothetical protein [Anaerosacchariphilus polymeriproducens]RDU24162.1 hypothetical protein DWV06_05535 [Anaerosacchariphilus polymeriproducens]
MCSDKLLYNINANTVKPGLECSYIKFVKELNCNLLKKYKKYYAGLQLYQNNCICNVFHIVAAYYDVPGIYKEEKIITDYISHVYKEVWGNSVERVSVFTFVSSSKIYE